MSGNCNLVYNKLPLCTLSRVSVYILICITLLNVERSVDHSRFKTLIDPLLHSTFCVTFWEDRDHRQAPTIEAILLVQLPLHLRWSSFPQNLHCSSNQFYRPTPLRSQSCLGQTPVVGYFPVGRWLPFPPVAQLIPWMGWVHRWSFWNQSRVV